MEKANKILVVIMLVGVFSLVSSGVAYAEYERNGDRSERREKRQAMYERLGVTDEQKKQLAEHRKSHRDSKGNYREQIKDKKQAFNEALRSGDTAEARRINSELKALKSQAQDQRLEGVIGVREILTDEQFSEFMAIKEQRKENRKNK